MNAKGVTIISQITTGVCAVTMMAQLSIRILSYQRVMIKNWSSVKSGMPHRK